MIDRVDGSSPTSFGATANADEDPRKTKAEALFQEGLKLHDKAREADALASFEKAYETLPTASSLFWIGREQHLLGRHLEALRHYRQAAVHPLANADTVRFSKQYAAELEPKFSRLVVKGPSGAVVVVDGMKIRLPMEGEPLDVNPGPITLTGERDGVTYEGSATLEAGKAGTVTLAARATASVTPPPSEPEPSNLARNATAGTLAGLALVGLGVGIGMSLHSNGQIDDAVAFNKSVQGGACARGGSASCTEYRSMLDDVRSTRNVATGAYIAGGVLALGAGATFLLWPSQKSTRGSVRPAIVNGGLGVTGVF